MNRRRFLAGLGAAPVVLALDDRPAPGDIEALKARERAAHPLRVVTAPAIDPQERARFLCMLEETGTVVLPPACDIDTIGPAGPQTGDKE